jgi:hypothetical protein
VTLSKNQLRDLRVSNENNQAKLFDHSQKQGKICDINDFPTDFSFWAIDQEVVAKLAEVDMIIADLDRANSRIASLEHRNVNYIFLYLHSCGVILLHRKFCERKWKLYAVNLGLRNGQL